MNKQKSLQFQFGQLKIRMEWESAVPSKAHPSDGRELWLVSEGPPDLLMFVRSAKSLPDRRTNKFLFDAPERWRLYEDKKGYLFEGIEQIKGESTETVRWRAWTSSDFKQIDFFMLEDPQRQEQEEFFWSPPLYPFLPMLLSAILPLKQGLLFHGLGVHYQKKGLLFLGADGGGKSTLAKLWKDSGEGEVLNDDRVILHKVSNRWMLFGTPWCGDFGSGSRGGVPLERIYVISHASGNRLEPFAPQEAFKRLLQQLFLAFWKKESVASAMALCEELLKDFSLHSFGFVKEPSAISFLLPSLNSVPSSHPALPAVAPT